MEFKWTTKILSLVWLFISYWYLDAAFDHYYHFSDPYGYDGGDIINCFGFYNIPLYVVLSFVFTGLASFWIAWNLFRENTNSFKAIYYIGFLEFNINLFIAIYFFEDYLSFDLFTELYLFALSFLTIKVINKEYGIGVVSNLKTFFHLYAPSILFWTLLICSSLYFLAQFLG